MTTMAIAENNTLFSDIQDLDAQLLEGGFSFKLTVNECGIKVCYDFGAIEGFFKISTKNRP